MSFAGIIRNSLLPFKGTTKTVLVEILLNCNYQDNPNYIFRNKKVPLKRGQWIASWERLAEDTGLTRQQIRTAQRNLKNLTILTTNNLTNHATLYTIVKIDEFLIKENEQPTKQPTKQPTPNQRLTINNKEDKKNKEYIYTSEFEEFWKHYGSIGNKKKAAISFEKVNTPLEVIMSGIDRYKIYMAENDWYHQKHAVTWLNDKGWEQEYSTKKEIKNVGTADFWN